MQLGDRIRSEWLNKDDFGVDGIAGEMSRVVL
jgi:hypothetical protein